MPGSHLYAGDAESVLREGLAATDDGLLVVNPPQDVIRELVYSVREIHPSATIQLLADSTPLKDLVDDFLIASVLADLVDEDYLAVRTLQTVPRNALLLSEEFVISLVDGGSSVAGLTTTDPDFVAGTVDHYRDRWRRAEEFSLRTPPLSRIRTTLETQIGDTAKTDFDRILESLDTARGNGEGLDEVTIALLIAAKNGELLYDISQWGEDIRLASKATFSRTKNQLEDVGLIDTEKVPIDVGRPRLRLKLGSSRYESADIEDLARRAQSKLAR